MSNNDLFLKTMKKLQENRKINKKLIKESNDHELEGEEKDVITIIDPDLSIDEFKEKQNRINDIIEETPEGEKVVDTEYVGMKIYTCSRCLNNFYSETEMSEDQTCPVCYEIPEEFIYIGTVEQQETQEDTDAVEEAEKELDGTNENENEENNNEEINNEEDLFNTTDEENEEDKGANESKQVNGQNNIINEDIVPVEVEEPMSQSEQTLVDLSNIYNQLDRAESIEDIANVIVIIPDESLKCVAQDTLDQCKNEYNYDTPYVANKVSEALKNENVIKENQRGDNKNKLEEDRDSTKVTLKYKNGTTEEINKDELTNKDMDNIVEILDNATNLIIDASDYKRISKENPTATFNDIININLNESTNQEEWILEDCDCDCDCEEEEDAEETLELDESIVIEAKFPLSLSKFIYDLDKDKGNAWSGNVPTKTNGVDVVEVYRNGKSENSMDDIINAVTNKYPQLEVYGKSNTSVFFKRKEKEIKTEDNSLENFNSVVVIYTSNANYTKYFELENPMTKEELQSIRKQIVNKELYIMDFVSKYNATEKRSKKELTPETYVMRIDSSKEENLEEWVLEDCDTCDNHKEESLLESAKFDYMLLDRLRSDCDYFIDNPSEKHLWAGSIDGQIDKMKEIYNSFKDEDKPEWITLDEIDNYKTKMKEAIKNK